MDRTGNPKRKRGTSPNCLRTFLTYVSGFHTAYVSGFHKYLLAKEEVTDGQDWKPEA